MKIIRIHFYECEHYGDLDNYKSDIIESGGRILNAELNYEAETAWVDVEIDETFMPKFKKTDACAFSNYQ
jgi:hypothetical protein